MPSLLELRQVTQADVYKGGVLAASLSRTGRHIAFSYLDDYRSAGGPPVASTLPIGADPVVQPAGALPPFFSGLLPEGRRLTALRQAVKTSADDELSLLLAVGRDTVGDVQVVPCGERPVAGEPWIQVETSFEEVSFTDVLTAAPGIDSAAIAGVQDKASAGMISAPLGKGDRRYILKLDPPEYPHVVANEAFFIDLAKRGGMAVVDAVVVHDAQRRPGLLVERFDRVAKDGSTVSLAVEDAAQVLGVYPADKYRVTSEEAVVALASLCAARVLALRELFRQLCFAWFTGNGDVHAKNLSIYRTAEGEWRVTPAYDLPSTLFYGDFTLALTVGGKNRGLSRRSWLEFAATIGLPASAAIRVLDDVLDRTADLPRLVREAQLPFGPQQLRAFEKNVKHRRATALTGQT